MRNYFCGWYFRIQSEAQTLALIPSIHKIGGKKFCEIQFISDADSLFARFSYSAFQKGRNRILIGQNQFGRDGIRLSIHTPTLHAPIDGAMVRTIHEHPSCRVYYRLESEHTVLLELDAARAAFEYEY